MSTDPQLLEEFLERICDRYTAAELIDILEAEGQVTVEDVVHMFKDELIEIRDKLDL